MSSPLPRTQVEHSTWVKHFTQGHFTPVTRVTCVTHAKRKNTAAASLYSYSDSDSYSYSYSYRYRYSHIFDKTIHKVSDQPPSTMSESIRVNLSSEFHVAASNPRLSLWTYYWT